MAPRIRPRGAARASARRRIRSRARPATTSRSTSRSPRRRPGHVLVASVGTEPERGYWGEVLTTGAEARGIVGLVIDGGVRDVDRARGARLPGVLVDDRVARRDEAAPGPRRRPRRSSVTSIVHAGRLDRRRRRRRHRRAPRAPRRRARGRSGRARPRKRGSSRSCAPAARPSSCSALDTQADHPRLTRALASEHHDRAQHLAALHLVERVPPPRRG